MGARISHRVWQALVVGLFVQIQNPVGMNAFVDNIHGAVVLQNLKRIRQKSRAGHSRLEATHIGICAGAAREILRRLRAGFRAVRNFSRRRVEDRTRGFQIEIGFAFGFPNPA